MDHLLLPKNPAHARIKVPYLCREEYQGPFETFPSRHGWTDERLRRREMSAEDVGELKSILQTWLFFGLLKEVFGEDLSDNEWISKGGSDCRFDTISTTQLRSQITNLHKSLELIPTDARQSRVRYIEKCLQIAIDVLNMFSLEDSPLIESEEVLSIAFLCDLIDKSCGTKSDAYRAAGHWHLGVPRLLQKMMLRDGWCKNDVYRLSHQLDLSSLYLASSLDRPEPHVSHKECTSRLCVKSQVDEGKYVTHHDTKSCDGTCKHARVLQSELISILQSGFVPLISYDADNAPDEINLVSATPGVSYIAISHVWSHGLGNPHDNSLPQCQMRRLTHFIRELCQISGSKPTLFWLDTICFPVHSPEAADLAIIFMRKTYADADMVLVIDTYLAATESQPLLYTECLVRILCSSWTRRLWTLQEGALAKSLYFQFADRAIDISNAAFMMQVEMTFVTSDRSLEFQPILSMISELWEAWKSRDSELPRVVLNYLSGGLRWRATSVAADEALCLATLTGLDMGTVMKGAPENRMVQFWSLLPSISAQAIFWSGSRIDQKGFRWAPSTFLGQPEAIFQDFANKSFSEADETAHTTRTASGLVFRSAGVLLNTWRANIRLDLWVRDQNKNWYRLHRQRTIVLKPRVDENQEGLRTIALITKKTLNQSFAGPAVERSITCVIASVYDVDEDRDIVYANTEDIAYLIPQGNASSFSIKEPLVVRIVTESEYNLGFPGCDDSLRNMKKSDQANDNGQDAPSGEEESGRQTSIPEMFDEVLENAKPAIGVREILGEGQNIDRARIRARDEDGRLSIDKDGEHFMLDGVELSEDQTWCLD